MLLAAWRLGRLFEQQDRIIIILISCFPDHPWYNLYATPERARRIPTRKADGAFRRNLETSQPRDLDNCKSVYDIETPRVRGSIYYMSVLWVFYYGVPENRGLLAN